MEKLYTVNTKKDPEMTSSDHQQLIAKFRIKLKKTRKKH